MFILFSIVPGIVPINYFFRASQKKHDIAPNIHYYTPRRDSL